MPPSSSASAPRCAASTPWATAPGARGKVTRKYIKDGHALVDIEIRGENQRGELTTPGLATVILPSRDVERPGVLRRGRRSTSSCRSCAELASEPCLRQPNQRPLAGIRVVERSRGVAAAYAGRLLGRHGRGHDAGRTARREARCGGSRPFWPRRRSVSALFAYLAAGSSSLVCDLKVPEGRATFAVAARARRTFSSTIRRSRNARRWDSTSPASPPDNPGPDPRLGAAVRGRWPKGWLEGARKSTRSMPRAKAILLPNGLSIGAVPRPAAGQDLRAFHRHAGRRSPPHWQRCPRCGRAGRASSSTYRQSRMQGWRSAPSRSSGLATARSSIASSARSAMAACSSAPTASSSC